MLGFAICLVLGRALLWKVFATGNEDEGFLHSILASLSHREKEAYRDLEDRCTLRAMRTPLSSVRLEWWVSMSSSLWGVIMTK